MMMMVVVVIFASSHLSTGVSPHSRSGDCFVVQRRSNHRAPVAVITRVD